VQHRDRILQRAQDTAIRYKAVLRIDRAALLDAYTATRDIRQRAKLFDVSVSGVTYALTQFCRYARAIECELLLGALDDHKCVVVVPVETREKAGDLVERLERLGFDAGIEEL